jgi:hypothetical protein
MVKTSTSPHELGDYYYYVGLEVNSFTPVCDANRIVPPRRASKYYAPFRCNVFSKYVAFIWGKLFLALDFDVTY